jgi:hypothetical protein
MTTIPSRQGLIAMFIYVTLAGFDLTTHRSSLVGGRRRRYRQTTSPEHSLWCSNPSTSFRNKMAEFCIKRQGCQMVCFQTKNPKLGKFYRALDCKMFIYFIAIWNILWRFGIFCDHLVHFVFTWYIFPVLVSFIKKNLATLLNGPKRVDNLERIFLSPSEKKIRNSFFFFLKNDFSSFKLKERSLFSING